MYYLAMNLPLDEYLRSTEKEQQVFSLQGRTSHMNPKHTERKSTMRAPGSKKDQKKQTSQTSKNVLKISL